MHTAYIGIGSNLGSKEENCRNAVKLLIENGIKVTSLSSGIRTEPWGVTDQPEFVNMAIRIETVLEPEDLLKLLKKIERDMGRRTTMRWGPRLIDLDILFYDELVLKTPVLEIPHPGITERYFVLKPLAEIAPGLVHPVVKKTIRELLTSINLK